VKSPSTRPASKGNRIVPVRSVQELLISVWHQPWLRLQFYLLPAAVARWRVRRLMSVVVMAAGDYGLAYRANPALTWLEGRGVTRVFSTLLEMPMHDAVMQMLRADVHSLPVTTDGGHLLGVTTVSHTRTQLYRKEICPGL